MKCPLSDKIGLCTQNKHQVQLTTHLLGSFVAEDFLKPSLPHAQILGDFLLMYCFWCVFSPMFSQLSHLNVDVGTMSPIDMARSSFRITMIKVRWGEGNSSLTREINIMTWRVYLVSTLISTQDVNTYWQRSTGKTSIRVILKPEMEVQRFRFLLSMAIWRFMVYQSISFQTKVINLEWLY